MNALMLELGVWIGSAATLGLIAGFFLCLGRPRSSSASTEAALTEQSALEQRVDELLEAQQRKDELLQELRTEVERAHDERRVAEESLRNAAATGADATSEAAARAAIEFEQLAAEHAKAMHEIEQMRARNRSLQERLDESADRLVELERARMQFRPQAVPSTDSMFTTPLSLDVEKSMPLTVEHDGMDELEDAKVVTVAVMTEPQVDEGAERTIADLPGMPDAVKERLTLIGAATNLAFLHKAGKRVGRRALIASTRLDEATVLGWLRVADLMRVGLRNEDLRALARAGVQSLADLARADAAKLAVRLQAKNESRGRTTIDAPAVQRWIDRAGSLESLVED